MSKKKINQSSLSQKEINVLRKEALELARIGLMQINSEGRILYLDKNAFWILDLEGIYKSPDKIIGSLIYDFMIIDEGMAKSIQKVFDKDVIRREEQNFKTISGLYKWIEFDSYHRRHEESGDELIQLIFQDITNRREAETALIDSEEQYRLLIENQGEGTAILDLDGRFLFCNQAGEEIFGARKGELIGRNLSDFTSAETFRAFKNQAEKRQIGEKETYEHEILRMDGAHRFLLTTTTTWLFNEGRITRLFCLFRDMTDRKNAEENLKSSLLEKEVMLKEIHHRVKNNLQVISSLLNLQSGYIEDDNFRTMFKESQDRVKTMALIHEKLYQSKDFAHINFAEYLKKLIASLTHSYKFEKKPTQLHFEMEKVFLGIDQAVPCGLVVNELISNALKHAFKNPEKGIISVIMIKKDEDEIEIIIKDNGKGLPDNFDIKQTNTLGMKLVSNLVEQLKGKLEVMSDAGAAFKILFKAMK